MIKETQKGLKCCAERHLLKSALAIAVYNKIGGLTYGGKKGVYFSKLEKLAEFFGVHPNSIWRVVTLLCKLGFLEKQAQENPRHVKAATFQSKNYRYVDHKEWAERHPGCCYKAADPDWELGDSLARELWRECHGKVRWYPSMLACLRKTGWTDQRIVQEWIVHRNVIRPIYQSNWKSAQGKFLRDIKQLVESSADIPAPV